MLKSQNLVACVFDMHFVFCIQQFILIYVPVKLIQYYHRKIYVLLWIFIIHEVINNSTYLNKCCHFLIQLNKNFSLLRDWKVGFLPPGSLLLWTMMSICANMRNASFKRIYLMQNAWRFERSDYKCIISLNFSCRHANFCQKNKNVSMCILQSHLFGCVAIFHHFSCYITAFFS